MTIDFETFLSEDTPATQDKVADKTPEAKEKPSPDDLKLTDDDEETPPPEDEEEDKEDSEEESDDDSEEDDAEKAKLKLDEDDDVAITAPNRAKILKEFPGLFKKFPTIEKAIYREQQYAEVFPHPKDAEQAKEGLKILANIETELGEGNIKNLLNSVKKFDEKAFDSITESFLPTLKELNPQAYFKTVNYVLKSALNQAKEYGSKSSDKESDQYQVAIAAKLLHRWIYNDEEMKAPTEIGSEKKTEIDPKEKELNDREQKFHQQALSSAVQEVDDKIASTLTRSIDSAIDPKGLMTPYVKRQAIKDTIEQFRGDLRKDKRFVTNLDHLWKLCRDDNYSDKSKTRIREAIKKQAQQVLPDIMRRVKADALKDYKKVAGSDRKSERPLERRRPSADNKGSSNKTGKFRLPEGQTSREFLLED